MRKLLAALGLLLLLILAIPVVLIATGTIDGSSLRMILNVMTGLGGPGADAATVAGRYRVPPGFSVQLYAADIPRARFLHFTEAGDLLVSRPHNGDILLLRRDTDGDGLPDGQEVLVEGLKRPLGLDTDDSWLYIAESHRVGRIAFDSDQGTTQGDYQALIEGFTDDGNHWSKTLRIGPDRRLYLAQGSTCNICEEPDPRRATMMRFNLDGGNAEIIATGLRNSVGFDWAPWSGALYATDNGRDLMGDDFPPCELNRIEADQFYGWPYFNGNNVPDPDMGADPLADNRQPIAPAHEFRAHNAPLGIHFPDAQGLPDDYDRVALVALHGSWNRSEPDGYKVVSLHFSEQGIEERDFLSGFNQDGDISGRPVDVAQGPDGAIYVSDDYAGAIYRIAYGETGTSALNLPARSTTEADTRPPQWLLDADREELASTGATLYARYGCAECHEQGANPKDLSNLPNRSDYAAVIDALVAPQAPMPIYPLEEAELRALTVYLMHPELRP